MKKLLSLLLTFVMVISIFAAVPSSAAEKDCSVTSTQSKSGNFNSNYTITGTGATDMVNIAMAQNERTQPQIGYTENWCADFVSDCAKLAGQGSAVPFNGAVNSMYNAVISAGGKRVSTAQAGDLVFFYASSESKLGHVGIALDSSRNISGNIFYMGASPSKVCILKNSSEGYSHWFYVRPNYKNNTHTHSYNTFAHYEAAHPHYHWYKCSCGAVNPDYSKTTYVSSCISCNLTVSYNANGGYGAPSNQTKKYLSDLTLSNKTPHRDGYAFCGWATSSNASSAIYFPEQNYSTHSALTLYAVWKEINGDTLTDYFGSEWWNEHKYVYYNLPVTWTEAYNICDSLGGHLVTISSSEENDFVLNLAKNYDNKYCWLGGINYNNESNWYWANGESFIYTKWSSSEPSNSGNGEHHIEMYINTGNEGAWNDSANAPASHVVSTGFICEYDDVYLESSAPSKTFTVGNHIYEVYSDSVEYNIAKRFCEQKSGHLLTIDSVSEQAGIYQNIQDTLKDEYWLGISDLNSEGTWLDINNNLISYANWYQGEPNDDFNCEDYAVIRKSDGSWHDLKGFSYKYRSIGFICEYDRDGTSCGENLSWNYDTTTKTLNISGTGKMYDFEVYDENNNKAMCPPWTEYRDEIETVIIEEGVTSIGDKAFYLCDNIKNIYIPTTITDIYGNAFGYTYIENVYIKDLTKYCKIDFHVPNRVSSSPMDGGKANLYLNNKLVTDLVVPDEITQLNANVFYGCASIKTITLHKNVTGVYRYSFDCPNLESITVLNPDCFVEGFARYKAKEITIYGYSDSYAEQYATNYNCKFVAIDNSFLLGDVDGDNDISIMDATLIQRHSAKQITLTDEQQKYADTDKDGKTSVMDATAIQRFIAKIITEF